MGIAVLSVHDREGVGGGISWRRVGRDRIGGAREFAGFSYGAGAGSGDDGGGTAGGIARGGGGAGDFACRGWEWGNFADLAGFDAGGGMVAVRGGVRYV